MMGSLCIETATGLVREWVRNGEPSTYDPAIHTLLKQEEPPLPNTKWDGRAFVEYVPPKTDSMLDKEDAVAKIDVALADREIPSAIKDALAAIKKVLG